MGLRSRVGGAIWAVVGRSKKRRRMCGKKEAELYALRVGQQPRLAARICLNELFFDGIGPAVVTGVIGREFVGIDKGGRRIWSYELRRGKVEHVLAWPPGAERYLLVTQCDYESPRRCWENEFLWNRQRLILLGAHRRRDVVAEVLGGRPKMMVSPDWNTWPDYVERMLPRRIEWRDAVLFKDFRDERVLGNLPVDGYLADVATDAQRVYVCRGTATGEDPETYRFLVDVYDARELVGRTRRCGGR